MFGASAANRSSEAAPDEAVPVLPPRAVPAVDRVRPVDLADLTRARREPIRPPAERGPDFAVAYDDTTLFFDAVQTIDGRILLIGPALLNLKRAIEGARVTALPSGAECTIRVEGFDRHARVTVAAPPGTVELAVDAPLARFRVPVGESRADAFAGRRVLLTLQRDNPIAWILDWVRFHRDRHGADAVLIYDNGSTAYRPEALLEALRGLDGIAQARVVSWPFKYGPQGNLGGGWDSDYCQLGALEHARWRYLGRARSVLSGDIDEFVVARDGRSVFEAAEASPFGLVRYDGIWVMGIEGREPAAGPAVRHRDYATRLRPRLRWSLRGRTDALACFVKWTGVPARCPDGAAWGVHRIGGWHASYLKTNRFTFRHFRQINTQWKYDRTILERFDPDRHAHDAALAAEYERVRWDR